MARPAPATANVARSTQTRNRAPSESDWSRVGFPIGDGRQAAHKTSRTQIAPVRPRSGEIRPSQVLRLLAYADSEADPCGIHLSARPCEGGHLAFTAMQIWPRHFQVEHVRRHIHCSRPVFSCQKTSKRNHASSHGLSAQLARAPFCCKHLILGFGDGKPCEPRLVRRHFKALSMPERCGTVLLCPGAEFHSFRMQVPVDFLLHVCTLNRHGPSFVALLKTRPIPGFAPNRR